MAVVIVVLIVGLAYLALGAGAANAQTNTSGVNVYNSDSSLTGAPITNDSSTWPGDSKTWNICAAIAMAEGYNVGPGTIPYDCNNPGDISDWAGTYGSVQTSGPGSSKVTTFPTAEAGWNGLWNKINASITGASSTYPKSLTWTEFANIYTGNTAGGNPAGAAAWLKNVTTYLGVDPNSTPADYVSS